MIYIYPNTLSTFIGNRSTALNVGYIEISDELYADLLETKKKWDNGQIVDDPTYSFRKADEAKEEAQLIKLAHVEALKAELAATDYQCLKYIEGWLSEEEYAPIKAHRQALRDEINQYEN